MSDSSFKELVQFLKNKKFNDMRKWVVNNAEGTTIRDIGDKLSDYLPNEPTAHAWLLTKTNEYQIKEFWAYDFTLNKQAYLTEVMAGCKFK